MSLKKVCFLFLTLSMILCIGITSADEISTQALPTTNLIMGLTFSGSTVQAYSQCVTVAPQSATVSIRIEKYINGSWIVVARSAGTRQTSTSCAGVSGVQYRAFATCTVYEDGKEIDSAKKYSATKVCP